MRSAFHFSPLIGQRATSNWIVVLFSWCQSLASTKRKKIKVLMQHDLKRDEFAVMVECGNKTLSHHSSNAIGTVKNVARQIDKYMRETNAEKQKKEPPTRAKSGRRPRRKSTAGVRGS